MFRFYFVLSVCWLSALSAQVPELIVPTGHTRNILHLEASPSGGFLASSSIDESVKIWDAAAGRELFTFRPGSMARDMAFSADEKTLAVAAFNRLHLLSTTDWREVGTHDGWNIHGVCSHPGKNEIYYFSQRRNSTGEDPIKVYALSLQTGSPRLLASVERAFDKKVAQLDISPDGTSLLLVQGGAAYLISTDGKTVGTAPGARRFTPDGDLFFLNIEGSLAAFGVRAIGGTERWRLSTKAAEFENQDMVHTMAFNAASSRFFWNNKAAKMANGDYRAGGASMYEMPPETDRVMTASPSGILYLANNKTFRIKAYTLPNLKDAREIGEPVLSPAQLAGSESLNQLSWGRGLIKSLRFLDGQVLAYGGPDGPHGSGRLKYAAKGELLAAAGASGDIFSYRAPERHDVVKRYKSGFADVRSVTASADGKRLAVIAKNGYLVMNTESDKSVAKGGLQPGDLYFQEHAALSQAGDKLLVSVARPVAGGAQTENYGRLIDLSNGLTLWEKKVSWEYPAFSADGREIVAETFENFVRFSVEDGKEVKRYPLPAGRFPSETAFNYTLSQAIYTHDNRAYVYDFAANREYQLEVPGQNIPFERAVFFGSDFVAVAGREGVLRIFDLRNREYVAALVRYADTDDWALVTPDGRFDASPGAMQRMYYRVGNQRVALEQLFDGFYTPGLAAEIFNRLPPGSPPPVNINQLKPAPEVEIGYVPGDTRGLIVEDDDGAAENYLRAQTQDAVIVVKGNAPQDRITDLRLYRNGKLLNDGERGLVVEDDTPEPAGNERRFRVRLLPGANAFRAVALNGQQTESSPAYLTVDYDGPVAPPANSPSSNASGMALTGPAGVTMHLVTVGIDKYANPSYNLNYAAADAAAIERRVDERARQLVGGIRRHTIRDAGATRAEILAKLEEVVAQADADDLLVFYFAGHGLVPDRKKGEFYLVPHDLTDSANGVSERGISATTLRQLSAAVSAERQLFLLDACQSGGALARLNATEEKAIASLARTTGTHWLTATDSEQLATEFDALGHGAFTYVLLEGMAGKADEGNDGAVSVNELKAYLERALPAITKQYGGRAQYPSSFGFGRDFVLVR